MDPLKDEPPSPGAAKLRAGLGRLRRLHASDVRTGESPKDAVFQVDEVVLYRYRSSTRSIRTPVLIVYALVNRPSIVDLQEDRSLVRALLDRGLDIYLVDWGYAGSMQRWLTLDDYINEYIAECVDFICRTHELPAINLLGVCQGGVLSLCYGALHPARLKTLTTMITPVDFHVVPDAHGGLLNAWAQGLDADLMTDAFGNVPGDLMNFGYLMLRPFQLMIGKYVDMIDSMDDPERLLNFLRMEQWIFDSPDQAGEAFRQFLRDFYQGNKLIKGEVVLGGRQVDLGQLVCPILNLYGLHDHLVPPRSSQALKSVVSSTDYREQGFDTGHVGVYVSSKVQKVLPRLMAEWLQNHE